MHAALMVGRGEGQPARRPGGGGRAGAPRSNRCVARAGTSRARSTAAAASAGAEGCCRAPRAAACTTAATSGSNTPCLQQQQQQRCVRGGEVGGQSQRQQGQ